MNNILLSLAVLGSVVGTAGVASADRGGHSGGTGGHVTSGGGHISSGANHVSGATHFSNPGRVTGGRVTVTGRGYEGNYRRGYGYGGRGYGYGYGYVGPAYGTTYVEPTYVEPAYVDGGYVEEAYVEPTVTVVAPRVLPRVVVRRGWHNGRYWR